jgi:MFS family permease
VRALLGFGALGIFWGVWGAAVPAVQRQTGANDGELGLALVLVGLGALVSMRATGVLGDRFGPRLTPIAVGAFGLAGVLPGLAASPPQLYVCLLVVGATSGAMDVAINADAVREEVRSAKPLLNLAHACFSAAVLVASLATGLLRSAGAGPELVFGLAAAIVVLAAIAMRPGSAETWEPGADVDPPRFFERIPAWLLVLGILGALAYWIEGTWQDWGALHLERTLGAPPAVSALGPALFAGSMTAGRLAGNSLLGRWAERRLLVIGALVAAVGTAVAALTSSAAIALVGIVLAGAGCSVLAPTIIGVAGRAAASRERATVVGSLTTLMYLGFLVGPAAVGGLADLATLRISLTAVAGLALLLALLFALVPLRRRPGSPNGAARG